ncbi:MAG: hypothetical protein ACE5JA_03220 [bacterium]
MYKHTQIGWVVLVSVGTAILLTGYIGILEPNWLVFSVLGMLIICLILFGTLTVNGNSTSIRIRFGPGLIRKSFRLDEIGSCTVVRNHWWYGWGIRRTVKGWLFNVSGLDAVELSMRDGTFYRIGTDEPRKLCDFLQRKLNERSR